ncbi:L-seryl-tRNA(Sec) kinase isoform X3 [Eptesicus fuscus]|uniref:L-seryl-tRNA(Sec) kinase isoform X3 n=1 Tax=Eptesicus fuscus TaxID=29078 RepID=UPI002403E248|nr:L-seryl-tRNA(Sec) kinase isoform X3 [Eptesicus fuscus]
MEAGEDARAARGEGPRRLGLCVLCGLPAAGKSTLARALSHQLRRERRWAVGVVAYDDVMPDAFPEEAAAGPLEGKQCVRAHRPLPPRWKALRRELLTCLEGFLRALLLRGPLSAPPGGTEALWEAFTACLRAQGLLRPAPAPEGPARHLPTPPAEGPLLLVLDDNFYYRSMRHEVYQLARRYSLGFCQLFLDCPLETCLQRNGRRPGALPPETIRLMRRRMEEPNPQKNAWEHNSLTVRSSAGSAEASPELTGLLLAALENPVTCVEDSAEQKEADRAVCSASTLHRADQALRRIVSQTMKEAKEIYWKRT